MRFGFGRNTVELGSNRFDRGSKRIPSERGSNPIPSERGSNRIPFETGSGRFEGGSNRIPRGAKRKRLMRQSPTGGAIWGGRWLVIEG